MANIFTVIFFNPILNVLIAIYHGLIFLHIPDPLGWSIILLTILIRLLLSPLVAQQLKTSRKMQTIAPHISALKEKHKNDAKILQSETMRLYKEHGVNPAAGCLPLILQLPIIWALYGVLQLMVNTNAHHVVSVVNSAVYIRPLALDSQIAQQFFSLPLGKSPSHLFATMPLVILFPILTGVFQLIQSKMLIVSQPKLPVKTGEAKEKSAQDDFSTALQTQSLYIFPVMIGFFSFTLPLGLSLYWNTFTIFGIIQQYQIQGLGGLQIWIDFLRKKLNK